MLLPKRRKQDLLAEALLREHGEQIFVFARQRLGNDEDADEVTMDTIAAATTQMLLKGRIDNPRAYVFGVAAKLILMKLRSRYRYQRHCDRAALDPTFAERPMAEVTAEEAEWQRQRELAHLVRETIRLNFSDGDARFFLAYLDGTPTSELMVMFEMKDLQAVHNRVAKLKKKLFKILRSLLENESA